MPVFKQPKENVDYSSKFIRVRRKLYTTDAGDFLTGHDVLAQREKIFDKVKRLKREEPDEVDAGGYSVHPWGILRAGRNSTKLGLPLTRVARTKTLQLFAEIAKNHKVEEDRSL